MKVTLVLSEAEVMAAVLSHVENESSLSELPRDNLKVFLKVNALGGVEAEICFTEVVSEVVP